MSCGIFEDAQTLSHRLGSVVSESSTASFLCVPVPDQVNVSFKLNILEN